MQLPDLWGLRAYPDIVYDGMILQLPIQVGSLVSNHALNDIGHLAVAYFLQEAAYRITEAGEEILKASTQDDD